ncbi:MAG: flippase [Candidatus Doudnabacteria bacterium]|nr:flippase [Candidatus Doudnabacteria bacterium]
MSAKKIVLNTLLQSAGKLISLFIGFASVLLLTRYLKEEGFGEYTTVITYMGFFGILADLGLYLVTTQLISQKGADEDKILGNIFSLRIISVLLALLLGAVLALAFPYSIQVKTAMFVAIINFAFVSATQVLVGVFQKHLVFYKLIGSEIVGRLVALGATAWFISRGLGLIFFIAALTLASVVHFFISFALARRLSPFRLKIDLTYWKFILSRSWPLAFSVVLNLIYFRADTLILSLLKPAAEVGIYGAAYKIFEVLLNFPAMFAGLIMPFLARFAYQEWATYRLYLQRSLDAILLVVIPVMTVVLFFAGQIIDVVAGEGFHNSDKVLMILIFAAGITFVGNLLGYTVVALNVQKKMVWGYFSGTLLGLVLYFLLIPRYSYFGAATATVVVELLVCVWAYRLTSQVANFFPSFQILPKALLAVLPAVALFHFVPGFWVVKLFGGVLSYGICLVLLKAVPYRFLHELVVRKDADDAG